jgi:hypothetical protein
LRHAGVGWTAREIAMPALIAHSHFHLAVFYAALFACFAPEWIGTFFQRVEKGARVRDRGSHVWIVMAVGMGVVAGIILVNANFPGTTLQRGQRLQFWIGIAVMLSGLAFRWYAIKSLGRFFTRTVATRAGQ